LLVDSGETANTQQARRTDEKEEKPPDVSTSQASGVSKASRCTQTNLAQNTSPDDGVMIEARVSDAKHGKRRLAPIAGCCHLANLMALSQSH